MHKNRIGFSIVVFVILVAVLVSLITVVLISRNSPQKDNVVNKISNVLAPTPTPSPGPFDSLTIPYLRSRDYESKLGGLTKYEDHEKYTSYLTSYDSDGLKINGLLTIPKGEGPWPAIVFVHGYIPPSLYKTTEKYVEYVDYLAKNGSVVFKIDLRGNGDSEGDPGGAYYSGDYVIDTLNAYSALQNANFVDAKKIGLWGHSMAGNVTFRAFVAKQNIPALVIWAGAVYTYDDMQKYHINDNSYRPPADNSRRTQERQKLRDTYGDYSPDSEFWQKVVPTNYLDGVTGAIEINHTQDDGVVNIGYSRDLMKILDKTNIEHKLIEYSSGGHNISGSSFTKAMQNTVEFFNEKLGN